MEEAKIVTTVLTDGSKLYEVYFAQVKFDVWDFYAATQLKLALETFAYAYEIV